MTENERLKILRQKLGFSTQEPFAQIFGLKQGSYSPYENDAPIPEQHIDKLQLKFNVNPEWIRKGKGEMFLTGNTTTIAKISKGKIKNVVAEAAHEYQMAKPVPYFDIDVSASNIEMFTDERELPTKAISIKGVEDCDFGVPIFGSSMYPTYENGTIIFCKRISDFDVLQYGEPHLIITKEQRFVKRILKGPDKSTVTLSSDNTDARDRDGKRRYENFEIPKNKILHLFIIKASYKRGQL